MLFKSEYSNNKKNKNYLNLKAEKVNLFSLSHILPFFTLLVTDLVIIKTFTLNSNEELLKYLQDKRCVQKKNHLFLLRDFDAKKAFAYLIFKSFQYTFVYKRVRLNLYSVKWAREIALHAKI